MAFPEDVYWIGLFLQGWVGFPGPIRGFLGALVLSFPLVRLSEATDEGTLLFASEPKNATGERAQIK